MVTYMQHMSALGVIAPRTPSFNTLEQPTQIAQTPPRNQQQLSLQESEVISRLQEALVYQNNQFERFRHLTEQKFTSLSKDVMELSIMLKEAHHTIHSYKDRLDVAQSREALRAYQQGSDRRAPVDKPIDRTGVAPKDVQISTIFNCSGKRF